MMEVFLPRSRLLVGDIGQEDVDALGDIHADAFAQAWSAEDFEAFVADPGIIALGLRRHSVFWPPRLVGFVLMRLVADEAEILTIAVKSGSRGKGLGRLLMDEALRRLYREGIESCFLEVDHANPAAVGLYRSLGFQTVGERKGYYHRLDGPAGAALVMRLGLR